MSARCVAFLDDEPLFSEALAFRISAAAPEIEILQFDRPRRLVDHPDVHRLSHALVDLSFGPLDLDAPDLRPEPETGLDAILLLEELAPQCRIVVVTTMGAPLAFATAQAIREIRPDVPFLNKADRRLPDHVAAVVAGELVQDNAEFGRLLAGVGVVPPQEITSALDGSTSRRSIIKLLLALSECPSEPSLADLQDRTGWRPQTVKNYLQELGTRLEVAEVIEPGLVGLGLWQWARPRRRLLSSLVSAG